MKILVVGSGGREHALAWKIASSPRVEKVIVAPGNAGTALERKTENVAIGADDVEGLLEFAKRTGIDLTIVGPEIPLVLGIRDRFNEEGLRCFGPTRDAARLEGSKAFSKEFLQRHDIPSAEFQVFTEPGPAKDYIRAQGIPIVVKADGLAAGKGVVIAQSEEEAFSTVEGMLSGESFGDAGRCVVIEEVLRGEEASFIVMVDEKSNILPLATSQDHKAINDGDTGPNTGGMGAYSPAPAVTPGIYERVMREIIEPTVKGMADDGSPYMGFLYAGLMISPEGNPKALEYNCRFGDPETQPILLRLRSDFVEISLAALEGRLDQINVQWDPRAALGVVMAAQGYPGPYPKGMAISGLPEQEREDLKVFHAGTTIQGDRVVTSGGRVLCVTALGNTVSDAQSRAYETTGQIQWDGAVYRTDIGYRAVARESAIKTG